MVTAVVDWPSRHLHRIRGSLGLGGDGDFELRHWRRPAKHVSGMRGRWAPPEIDIPNPKGGGYTSLRDIMSSPEYAASSPGGGAASRGGDVRTIRHPLVKHAAYAYLQLTPSAPEEVRRRRRRRRGPLRRLLLGCLGFVGALFGR